MVAVPSTMLPLGTPLPAFTLPDTVSGGDWSPTSVAEARALLVMFICNHCPYVRHIMHAFGPLARDYAPRGLAVVAISANDAERYPADAPARMRELAREQGWDFPYLFDDSQDTARAFRAACTPDFFLFDADRRLTYRGQFDGSRPKSDEPVTGSDLRAAIDAVLDGRRVPDPQTPSIGCNIKGKLGNEPDYFPR